jgi:acylphosphatase
MLSKQIFIGGRVQGVFFRDATRLKANQLKLVGWVRNLSDGRVEVRVEGDDPVVQLLIKWLKAGPKYAKVSTIEVIDLPIGSLQSLQGKEFEVWATH